MRGNRKRAINLKYSEKRILSSKSFPKKVGGGNKDLAVLGPCLLRNMGNVVR